MDTIEEFIAEGLATVTTTKTYTSAGKGRKQCPKCHSYIGVRTFVCHCGHDFSSAPKKVTVNPDTQEVLSEKLTKFIHGINPGIGRVVLIYAANGRCPLKLEEFDYDSVKSFCEELIDSGLKIGKLYTPIAIKTWLSKELTKDSETVCNVLKYVDQWASEVSK